MRELVLEVLPRKSTVVGFDNWKGKSRGGNARGVVRGSMYLAESRVGR
jgi:hypothetical protein